MDELQLLASLPAVDVEDMDELQLLEMMMM